MEIRILIQVIRGCVQIPSQPLRHYPTSGLFDLVPRNAFQAILEVMLHLRERGAEFPPLRCFYPVHIAPVVLRYA